MKWFQVVTADGNPASFTVLRTEAEAQAELDRLTKEYPEPMIGGRIAVKCEEPSKLYVTTASESYDGFGTYTVERIDAKRRIVDIADCHANWQIGRNMSGMESTILLETWREANEVSDEDLSAAAAMWDGIIAKIG